MLDIKLKKYDRFLSIRKKLNGEKTIERKSPFNSQKSFEVFSIQNQYLGSGSWILKKISRMDEQRNNIVGEVLLDSDKRQYEKDDNRMTKEVADYMANGGEQFVN
jgi:hypothetical protein